MEAGHLHLPRTGADQGEVAAPKVWAAWGHSAAACQVASLSQQQQQLAEDDPSQLMVQVGVEVGREGAHHQSLKRRAGREEGRVGRHLRQLWGVGVSQRWESCQADLALWVALAPS